LSAVENIKDLAEFVRRFNDIELNRRILNLEQDVIDLSRDRRRLEDRLEELERALRFKESLSYKAPFYWLEGDSTPFCPACWDSKRTATHVTRDLVPGFGPRLVCAVCKNNYPVRSGI